LHPAEGLFDRRGRQNRDGYGNWERKNRRRGHLHRRRREDCRERYGRRSHRRDDQRWWRRGRPWSSTGRSATSATTSSASVPAFSPTAS
jgi:hypothetical protein